MRLPLKYYSPRQTKRGVTARIYGRRILHPHAFIIGSGAKWGRGVKKEGGVYRRLTKKRFPIMKLTGPAVPIEMIRDHSVEAFRNALGEVFPAELERLISRG